MVEAILTFEEIAFSDYKIKNCREIEYRLNDSYSNKVFYGYRTIFTYLKCFDNGLINDKSFVNKKLGLVCKLWCYFFSLYIFLKYFFADFIQFLVLQEL